MKVYGRRELILMNNRNQRYKLLDIARFIFAFLVVTVHVPVGGGNFLRTISCLAVPYFYMLTAFFLYKEDANQFAHSLKVTIKKCGLMWLKFFMILSVGAIAFKLYYHNDLSWTSKDFFDQFIMYGNCHAAEVVNYNGKDYGTSALWFLYGEFISLAIIYPVRRMFHSVLTPWLIIVPFFIITTYVNYHEYFIPRILSTPLVFLSVGLLMRRVIEYLKSKQLFRYRYLIIGAIASFFLSVLEQYSLNCDFYSRFSLLPFAVFVFALLVKINDVKIIDRLPVLNVKIPMYVYIWHRFIYFIMVAVIGFSIYKIDAILVFLVSLAIFYFVLRILENCRIYKGSD